MPIGRPLWLPFAKISWVAVASHSWVARSMLCFLWTHTYLFPSGPWLHMPRSKKVLAYLSGTKSSKGGSGIQVSIPQVRRGKWKSWTSFHLYWRRVRPLSLPSLKLPKRVKVLLRVPLRWFFFFFSSIRGEPFPSWKYNSREHSFSCCEVSFH